MCCITCSQSFLSSRENAVAITGLGGRLGKNDAEFIAFTKVDRSGKSALRMVVVG
jgi:hypothetical protein